MVVEEKKCVLFFEIVSLPNFGYPGLPLEVKLASDSETYL